MVLRLRPTHLSGNVFKVGLLVLLLLSRHTGELWIIEVEEMGMEGRTVGHCEEFDWNGELVGGMGG